MTGQAVYTTWRSPIGELRLAASDGVLNEIRLPGRRPDGAGPSDPGPFADAIAQLREYFAGARTTFSIPFEPNGSAFERTVWKALLEVPYGRTVSYGELAERIGLPGRARAVGWANGRNPIPIVIPCHRVIGSDGSLVGYGGGLELKRTLLELEHALPARLPVA